MGSVKCRLPRAFHTLPCWPRQAASLVDRITVCNAYSPRAGIHQAHALRVPPPYPRSRSLSLSSFSSNIYVCSVGTVDV
jgi:hypothetical protein